MSKATIAEAAVPVEPMARGNQRKSSPRTAPMSAGNARLAPVAATAAAGTRPARSYGITAVDRAIDVLNCFSGDEPELTLARITILSALPKPTVFRLLKTLARRGLVTQRVPSGTYVLGHALIGMSEIAKLRNGVVAAALPALRRLREMLNETAYLSVRVGDARIDVEQFESTQSVRRVMTLGDPKELYAGCASRVLLAGMSDDEIDAYLKRTKLVAFGRYTLTDANRLRASVAKTRKLGYAEGWDERNSGGAGIAAPIYGPRNDVLAAIAVGSPTHRFDAGLRERAVRAVLAAAADVSRELGQTHTPIRSPTRAPIRESIARQTRGAALDPMPGQSRTQIGGRGPARTHNGSSTSADAQTRSAPRVPAPGSKR